MLPSKAPVRNQPGGNLGEHNGRGSVSDTRKLPDGWMTIRVDQAGSVRVGRQRSPDKHTGQFSTKYIRAANITPHGLDLTDLLEMDFTPSERATFSLNVGDVLLTEASGSAEQVGRAALWRGEIDECCYQNTVIRFRAHLALPEYALLVIRHYGASGVFARVARGVGIQHLGASRFAILPFPLPPLAEQARIVEATQRRFSEILEAEVRLRSVRSHLDEQVREILAAAVVGELVEQVASPAPKSPNRSLSTQRGKRSQSRSGQGSLFSSAEHETPNEETFSKTLPGGWQWVRVGEAGDVTVGRQRTPSKHTGRYTTKYVRAANITPTGLDLTNLLEMDFTAAEREKFALKVGDVLLTEASGSADQVGRAALWRGEIAECCYQNTVIRFRPRTALPEYALLVFRHYGISGFFAKAARGVGIQHLGASRFAALPFALPPLEEQRRIVEEANRRLESVTAQINAVDASLTRLPEMERELLAAAVAGELTPQLLTDEPASVLLERLGPPSSKSSMILGNRDGATSLPAKRKPRGRQSGPNFDLATILRRAGRPLPLPELFGQAGYDRDQPEHVELFYLALRAQLGRTIRQVGDDRENAVLEVVDAD